MAPLLRGWTVEDWSISDHWAILILLGVPERPPRLKERRTRAARGDYVSRLASERLAAQIDGDADHRGGSQRDGEITRMLVAAAGKQSLPGDRNGIEGGDWWTPELTDLRRIIRRERNRIIATGKGAGYRQAWNRYVLALHRARRDSWHRWVTEDVEDDVWGRFYRFARGRLRHRVAGVCSLDDGQSAQTTVGSWQEVFARFLPRDDMSHDLASHSATKDLVAIDYAGGAPDEGEFTEVDLKAAI